MAQPSVLPATGTTRRGAIHPELLEYDPYLNIPYWDGPYPKHPATAPWREMALYYIAMVDMNVGAPKKYPFKPVIVVLTRKSLVVFKATDLSLCRRITFDTVGALYSNAQREGPSSSRGSDGGASNTGFLIMRETPHSGAVVSPTAASAPPMPKPTNKKSNGGGVGAGDSVGWGGDIALQGSKTVVRQLVDRLMVLLCNAKHLALDDIRMGSTTFGGALPSAALGGGLTVDLSRGDETSLIDTTVVFKPPPKTMDPRLAFLRMDHVMIPRALVAERFMVENPSWRPPADANRGGGGVAMQTSGTAAAAAAPNVGGGLEATTTPLCATAVRVQGQEVRPTDFLPPAVPEPKLALLYRPIQCVSLLWCGLLALVPDAATTASSSPEARGTAGPLQPPGGSTAAAAKPGQAIVAAFVTQRYLYVACNGFDILQSIPVDGIRTVFLQEKHSKRRQQQQQQPALQTSSSASLVETPSIWTTSPTTSGNPADGAAMRIRCVLVYHALVPPTVGPADPHTSNKASGSDADALLAGWTWQPATLTVEFESQASALSFFLTLKSVAPASWRVDQLQELGSALQIEEERTNLCIESPSYGPPPVPEPHLRNPQFVELWCPRWKRSVDVEWVAFRVRLYAFYEAYCPHKLALVDRVMWDWREQPGGCDEVIGTLSRKYGNEPDAPLQEIVPLLVEMEPTVAAAYHNISGVVSIRSGSDGGGGGMRRNGVATPPQQAASNRSARSPSQEEAQQRSTTTRAAPQATLKTMQSEPFAQPMPTTTSFRSDQSMRSAASGPRQALTTDALHRLGAPPPTKAEAIAAALGQQQPSAAVRSPDVLSMPSMRSMSGMASATGPVVGATIGDVLRSYGFSVTFFDRFAAMYFPANSNISSTCEEPEKVRTFERLIHSYAPNEDSFYAALVDRAEQRRRADRPSMAVDNNVGGATQMGSPSAANPGASFVSRGVVASASTTPQHATPVAQPFYAQEYAPDESARAGAPPSITTSNHVDPTSVWTQRSNTDATMVSRYRTQTLNTRSPTPGSTSAYRAVGNPQQPSTTTGQYCIAHDDLKAMVLEPFSSSVRGDGVLGGGDGGGLPASMAMLPPMFSAKKPDAFQGTSSVSGRDNRVRRYV